MNNVILVLDLDGTLCDYRHREHLLRSFCVQCGSEGNNTCKFCGHDAFSIPTSSWQAFTNPDLFTKDGVIPKSLEVVRDLVSKGAQWHVITGRRYVARAQTQEWLVRNFGFDSKHNTLIMREHDSFDIPASVYKERAFHKLLEIRGLSGKETFIFFEDDSHVLPMYSTHGIALSAPQCWDLLYHPKSNNIEPLMCK